MPGRVETDDAIELSLLNIKSNVLFHLASKRVDNRTWFCKAKLEIKLSNVLYCADAFEAIGSLSSQ